MQARHLVTIPAVQDGGVLEIAPNNAHIARPPRRVDWMGGVTLAHAGMNGWIFLQSTEEAVGSVQVRGQPHQSSVKCHL